MQFLQGMLQISWTAKKSNEIVLSEDDMTRSSIGRIRKRQVTFNSHVMKKEKVE